MSRGFQYFLQLNACLPLWFLLSNLLDDRWCNILVNFVSICMHFRNVLNSFALSFKLNSSMCTSALSSTHAPRMQCTFHWWFLWKVTWSYITHVIVANNFVFLKAVRERFSDHVVIITLWQFEVLVWYDKFESWQIM